MTATTEPAISRWRTIAVPFRRALWILVSLGLLLLAWQLLHSYVVHPRLLPSPGNVAVTGWNLLKSGELQQHVLISLTRIGVGYTAGCIIGITLGLLMGRSTVFHDLMAPIIELIRPISPIAMVPIVLIWLGVGETAKYVLVGYASVVIVLINTAFGVQNTPIIRERAATCLGASERQVFLLVVLPSATPYIVTGMRMALGFSFMGIVAAEMVAAEAGIGFLIMQSRMFMQVNYTFVGMLALGVIGASSDLLFRLTVSRFARRYQEELYNV